MRGTLHWVSEEHALPAEVRLYGPLFKCEDPYEGKPDADFVSNLDPDSLEVLRSARVEPSLAEAAPGSGFQFERLGYFCVDSDSTPGSPVFNRTVTLRDSWARIAKQKPGPS